MDEQRLSGILEGFERVNVLVVGDFFLDKYLVIEEALGEVSLETGLEAYQVVEVRSSPGAAGTVTSNLRALGVEVVALGAIGGDGEGYELKRGLMQRGVRIGPLIECPDRFTPTYTKPMMRKRDGQEREINRLDIKNRTPLAPWAEQGIIERLRSQVPRMDGVIVADQVPERNCGSITDRVREEIARLARQHPHIIFAADSRTRIGLFREVIIKPNEREAALALSNDPTGAALSEAEGPVVSALEGRALSAVEGEIDLALAWESGRRLFRRNRKPVFVTVGDQGVLLFAEGREEHVPVVEVTGEIDIVGAGDSVMAGIVASLCSGADCLEAALVGNLVASITIQQIGTTGIASRQQVLERYRSLSHTGQA
jgi:bifunctional ADP-heptose synthase (sugar kinase/adenylyltransferase)